MVLPKPTLACSSYSTCRPHPQGAASTHAASPISLRVSSPWVLELHKGERRRSRWQLQVDVADAPILQQHSKQQACQSRYLQNVRGFDEQSLQDIDIYMS